MRTTKRFTPDLLDRYRAIGRGLGTYEHYVPWHRVSRSDPSSLGRSHLMIWRQRQRELLSDDEWVAALFTTMANDVDDLREQFPLALTDASHELGAYDVRLAVPNLPGTIEVARNLGIRHPRVNGNGRSAPWVMTTDLLITLVDVNEGRRLLAVSCKSGRPDDRRTKELLRIERHYWTVRGVAWLMLTPDLYEESVELTLRNSMHWALGEPVSDAAKKTATTVATEFVGLSLVSTLDCLERTLGGSGDLDLARRAFWQAVWSGELCLDLRRGWRPHLPTSFLSPAAFLSLNPIASRRSAWN